MAKRKIYDIVPPQKRKKTLLSVKDNSLETPGKEIEDLPKNQIKKIKENFTTSKIAFLLVFVLFILLGFWFFSSAKSVTVEIKPKIHTSTLNTTIAFSTSTQDLDLSKIGISNIIIPAQEVKMEKDFRKEFPSSLISVKEKAKGIIRVYNKHNRLVSLVQGTRFLSSTKPAKLFRSLKKISIPAGGYVDVPVEAAESGDSYNIDSCAFSIPGLRNYSPPQLYYDVFGKSLSKMQGGRIEKVHKITKENLQQAKATLTESVTKDSRQALQEKVGNDFVIIQKTISFKPLDDGLIGASLGEETPSFVYHLKGEISALKVKQSFLSEFSKRYIALNIPTPMKAVDNKTQINFVSEDSKELTSDVEIKAEIYQEIDTGSLKEIIKGRKLKEIPRYVLEVAPYLDGPPKIIFRPFWARKATLDPNKIKIKMDF